MPFGLVQCSENFWRVAMGLGIRQWMSAVFLVFGSSAYASELGYLSVSNQLQNQITIDETTGKVWFHRNDAVSEEEFQRSFREFNSQSPYVTRRTQSHIEMGSDTARIERVLGQFFLYVDFGGCTGSPCQGDILGAVCIMDIGVRNPTLGQSAVPVFYHPTPKPISYGGEVLDPVGGEIMMHRFQVKLFDYDGSNPIKKGEFGCHLGKIDLFETAAQTNRIGSLSFRADAQDRDRIGYFSESSSRPFVNFSVSQEFRNTDASIIGYKTQKLQVPYQNPVTGVTEPGYVCEYEVDVQNIRPNDLGDYKLGVVNQDVFYFNTPLVIYLDDDLPIAQFSSTAVSGQVLPVQHFVMKSEVRPRHPEGSAHEEHCQSGGVRLSRKDSAGVFQEIQRVDFITHNYNYLFD